MYVIIELLSSEKRGKKKKTLQVFELSTRPVCSTIISIFLRKEKKNTFFKLKSVVREYNENL